MNFYHVFLRERFITVGGRYIHHNPDVFQALRKFAPDVVVTDGFNPTHLYAFGYCVAKKWIHVAMTDGTDVSEKSLSMLHRIARRMVYAKSKAFISASRGGQRLYESYGISERDCFRSCLCADNDAFAPAAPLRREFDFIFCGRIEAVKNPLFALDVAVNVAKRLERKTRILFVGAGSEEGAVTRAALAQSEFVDTQFHGFATQGELPSLYQSAKLFLFPTLWDPWGVVANEACAAGLPVITSPEAGVAGELVVDGENGFVCALDTDKWAERASALLNDDHQWELFSRRSVALVDEYSYDAAATGLADACRHAISTELPYGRRITAE